LDYIITLKKRKSKELQETNNETKISKKKPIKGKVERSQKKN